MSTKSGTSINDRPASSAEFPEGTELLTKAQFAKRVQVSLNTVGNWMSQGRLVLGKDYIKVGRVVRILFEPALIERLLEESTKTTENNEKSSKRAKSIGKPRIDLD